MSFLYDQLECNSTVTKIDKVDNQFLIQTETTVLYPSGGGQPCDTGTMVNDQFEGDIVSVEKKEDRIIHTITTKKGELKEGDTVHLTVDKQRREKLSKMHSGEHLLFQCIKKIIPTAMVSKVAIDEKESTFYATSPEPLTWDSLIKAEAKARKMIKNKTQVTIHEIKKEEIGKFPDLRIRLDRIASPTIRVVEINDFDYSACAGTHVKNAQEIGNILITGFNSLGKNLYEIRFVVDSEEELYRLASIARTIQGIIGGPLEDLPSRISSLKEKEESNKEQLRKLQENQDITPEEITVGSSTILFHTFDNFEKKQLIDKANELKKKNAVVCFLNHTEKSTQVVLVRGEGIASKASDILISLTNDLGGRGGGRDDFAMGSLDNPYPEKIKTILSSLLQ